MFFASDLCTSSIIQTAQPLTSSKVACELCSCRIILATRRLCPYATWSKSKRVWNAIYLIKFDLFKSSLLLVAHCDRDFICNRILIVQRQLAPIGLNCACHLCRGVISQSLVELTIHFQWTLTAMALEAKRKTGVSVQSRLYSLFSCQSCRIGRSRARKKRDLKKHGLVSRTGAVGVRTSGSVSFYHVAHTLITCG